MFLVEPELGQDVKQLHVHWSHLSVIHTCKSKRGKGVRCMTSLELVVPQIHHASEICFAKRRIAPQILLFYFPIGPVYFLPKNRTCAKDPCDSKDKSREAAALLSQLYGKHPVTEVRLSYTFIHYIIYIAGAVNHDETTVSWRSIKIAELFNHTTTQPL